MKRTGIKRGTTRLARTGPLKSNGWIGRGKAIKSVRPKVTPEEKYGRDTVEERATFDDEVVCEIWLPGCTWYGQEWHHRRNRTQGGPWDPSNGLMLCAFCHRSITSPFQGKDTFLTNGWLVESDTDWLTKPVLYRGSRLVLLTDEGTQPVPFEEEEAS